VQLGSGGTEQSLSSDDGPAPTGTPTMQAVIAARLAQLSPLENRSRIHVERASFQNQASEK